MLYLLLFLLESLSCGDNQRVLVNLKNILWSAKSRWKSSQGNYMQLMEIKLSEGS